MELSPLARKARGTLRTAVGVHWVHGIADASVSKGPVIQRAALRNVICGNNQSCNIELKRESSTHTPFVPCFSALPAAQRQYAEEKATNSHGRLSPYRGRQRAA